MENIVLSLNDADFPENDEQAPVAEDDDFSSHEIDKDDGQNERKNTKEEEHRRYKSSAPIALNLSEELKAGYKILTGLMAWSFKNINWPFMDSIENTDPELYESYIEKIDRPMWLKKMKQKFEAYEYDTITEFVADFRLMLENCYHFNGPDHFVSKRAVKLETMLEQKLALLSRDIREKTTIAATSGHKEEDGVLGPRRRPRTLVPHNSSLLMNQLREEQIQRKKERRRKMILDRRAEREALAQEITSWEENVLFDGKKDSMKAMWEIPQVGLFLFLLQDPLNVGEVMHFELERCFMMPRESSTMQRIMTSLLSTPFQRLKIDKKTLMPYHVWERKLRYKMQVWYKIYNDCHKSVERTCSKLGLDENFFRVVGSRSPMERKRYHELSFYRKVWIMKALCDHCLHMQETLRDMIELQSYEDQRELVLGTDAAGQRYIHFPQFCGADVRVYRQAPFKYPKIEIKPDPFDSKRKYPFVYKPPPRKKVKLKKKGKPASAVTASPVKSLASERSSPTASPMRQRPSRLRQAPKSVVPMQLADDASMTEGTNTDADEELSDSDTNTSHGPADIHDPKSGPSGLHSKKPASRKKFKKRGKHNDLSDDDDDEKASDTQSLSGSDVTIPYCDNDNNSDSNSNVSSRDCSRDSSPSPYRSDRRGRILSQGTCSSDASREDSPNVITTADFIPRRSDRLNRSNDVSRDASPLIFDSDFGLRRGKRRGAALKNMPPYNAARDLSSFLYDENSASNSSLGGESNLLERKTSSFWKEKLLLSRQGSDETGDGEESSSCDISNLFSKYKEDRLTPTDNDNQGGVRDVDSESTVAKAVEPSSQSGDISSENVPVSIEVPVSCTTVLQIDMEVDNVNNVTKPIADVSVQSESAVCSQTINSSLTVNNLPDTVLTSSTEEKSASFNADSSTNSGNRSLLDNNSEHNSSTSVSKGINSSVTLNSITEQTFSHSSNSLSSVGVLDTEHYTFSPLISAMDGRNLDLTGSLFNEESDSLAGMESDGDSTLDDSIKSRLEICENASKEFNVKSLTPVHGNGEDSLAGITKQLPASTVNESARRTDENQFDKPPNDCSDRSESVEKCEENSSVNHAIKPCLGISNESDTLVNQNDGMDAEHPIQGAVENDSEDFGGSKSNAELTEVTNGNKEKHGEMTRRDSSGSSNDLNKINEKGGLSGPIGVNTTSDSTVVKEGSIEEVLLEPQADSKALDSDTNQGNETVTLTEKGTGDNSCDQSNTKANENREMDIENHEVDSKDIVSSEKLKDDKEDNKSAYEEDTMETDEATKEESKETVNEEADIKTEPESESEQEEEEIFPDEREFMMVADSVAELRKLTESFAEPEPIILRRGKKEVVQKMPPRKRNVVLLHERLSCLLKELEPWEGKLQQATRNARIRLRREIDDYTETEQDRAGVWNSTDEETESGESDTEQTDVKPTVKPQSTPGSNSNSRASTPVKPLDDSDEIDVSQRGRLRKRRIIPNNVEDQYAVKKSRSVVKTETSTSTDPVILNQSKTELVDYADILRQLKQSGNVMPILIKTSQGGRTVLTSVTPVVTNVLSGHTGQTTSVTNAGAGKSVQSLSMVRLKSPPLSQIATVARQAEGQATGLSSGQEQVADLQQGSEGSKLSQHPTIRTLLSASLGTINLSSASQGNGASQVVSGYIVKTEGNYMHTGANSAKTLTTVAIPGAGKMSVIKVFKAQTGLAKLPTTALEAGETISTTVAAGISTPGQTKTSPVTTSPPLTIVHCPKVTSTVPRKIAPRVSGESCSATPTTKATEPKTYYATDVSMLPPEVCAHLITNKKAQFARDNKNILLIPVENDKSKSSTVSVTTPVKVPPSSSTFSPVASSQVSPKLDTPSSSSTTADTPSKSSPSQLILPKLPVTAQFNTLPVRLQAAIVSQAGVHPQLLNALNIRMPLNRMGTPSSQSPNRYPSNETVRNLLDKRKSSESTEKSQPYKFMRLYLNSTTKSVDISLTMQGEQHASTTPVSTLAKFGADTNLTSENIETGSQVRATSVAQVPKASASLNSALPAQLAGAIKGQQCVITSISPAKLNTLLLQTSAAGAKSIPSLIKLPSKAALDSAVKAVVTSVHTTLPTVNIKVPSPTSLPNIGPRRNVTKTIQTMKSPIPVAPKVVTQSSGSLKSIPSSVSPTSVPQLMVVPSMAGCGTGASNTSQQATGLLQQVQLLSSTLASPMVAGLSSSLSSQYPVSLPNASQVSPLNIATGSVPANVQNAGDKKLTPHLILTSKGDMRVGYLGNDGSLMSSKRETDINTTTCTIPAVPMMGVTDADGIVNKPVIALNAKGNPIGAIRPGSMPPLVHLSGAEANPVKTEVDGKPGAVQVKTETTEVAKPSAFMSTGLVSPSALGMNLGSGLFMSGGVPLALQLLRSPSTTQALPNTGLQTATQPLKITDRYLYGLANKGTRMPLTSSPTPNIFSYVSPSSAMQIPTASLPQGPQSVHQPVRLVSPLPSAAIQQSAGGDGKQQLVFQYPAARRQLVAGTTGLQAANVNLLAGNAQLLSQMASNIAASGAATSQLPMQQAANSTGTGVIDSLKTSTLTQQKLLLFSIGGQLVTGQGVPVTLSNGQLKVLPQGKVKINNQTLTQEQIKQTLAKMSNSAASLALPGKALAATAPGKVNPAPVASPRVQQPQTSPVGSNVAIVPWVTCAKVATGDENSDNCNKTPATTLSSPNVQLATEVIKNKPGLGQIVYDNDGVPVKIIPEKTVGYTNVLFDHNNVPVKIERHPPNSVQLTSNSGSENLADPPTVLTYGVNSVRADVHSSTNSNNGKSMSYSPKSASSMFNATKEAVTGSEGNTINGQGDAHQSYMEVKVEVNSEEADDGDRLVINDTLGTDNEAALNLLTLANQALQPQSVKVEQHPDD